MTFSKTFALPFLALIAFAGSTGHAQEDGKREKGDRDGRRPAPEMFESLTPEERGRVREAFAAVWNDPAVVQSRDEVGRATKAYKEAMHEAIAAADPETAAILLRVRKEQGERGRPGFQEGGEGPRGPKGGGAKGKAKGKPEGDVEDRAVSGITRMVENPPFLRELSEEDRAIYQAARVQAGESESVKALLAQLVDNRKAEEARRDARIELFENLMKTYFDEMSASDPRVAELLKDRQPVGGRRGE